MSASPQRAGWNNPFIAATDLKPGEFGQYSKLSIRRLTYVDWPLHTRLYAILFQQAFGFDGELGVIMSKNKFPKAPPIISPITPRGITTLLELAGIEGYRVAGKEIDAEVKAAIRIDKYTLRNALQLDEEKGLISRCKMNCPPAALLNCTMAEAMEKNLITEFCDMSTRQRQALHWSKITVYLLAHPKPPKSMEPYREFSTSGGKPPLALKETNQSNGLQLFFGFVGDKTVAERLLKRPEIRKEIEEYDRQLAEVRGSLEETKKKEAELVKSLKSFAEQAAQLNLFDDSSTPFPSLPSSGGDSIPRPSSHATAASHGDGNSAEGAVSSAAAVEAAPVDWDAVGRAAAEYASINDTWVQQIVARCRQQTPDVTPAEIAQLVHQKGRAATKKDNPAGFLMTYVPQDCAGESFRRMRERVKHEAERDALRKQRDAEATAEYREPTIDEQIAEADRHILEAREQLKAAKKTGRSLAIVDAENRLYAFERHREQLQRQLTEVAS